MDDSWDWIEDYSEGSICPECDTGYLQWKEVENCSCHIHSPCSKCVDNILECPECLWQEDDYNGIEFLTKKEMEL